MSTDTAPLLATPRIAAGVLYRNEAGHVLLVKPTYKDGWDIPGGYVEPGESPLAAARREVIEELGTELPIAGLLLVDWAPAPKEGDKMLFVFDGGQLTDEQYAAVTPDGQEIGTTAFHDPAAIDDLMPDRLVRRVRTALDAAPGRSEHYAEHGTRALS